MLAPTGFKKCVLIWAQPLLRPGALGMLGSAHSTGFRELPSGPYTPVSASSKLSQHPTRRRRTFLNMSDGRTECSPALSRGLPGPHLGVVPGGAQGTRVSQRSSPWPQGQGSLCQSRGLADTCPLPTPLPSFLILSPFSKIMSAVTSSSSRPPQEPKPTGVMPPRSHSGVATLCVPVAPSLGV